MEILSIVQVIAYNVALEFRGLERKGKYDSFLEYDERLQYVL